MNKTNLAESLPPVFQEKSKLEPKKTIIQLDDVNIHYGSFLAVKHASMEIYEHEVTAFIGPSGCGKSTVLRSINRMNDLIRGATLDGRVLFNGEDLYAKDVDPVLIRRRIGMVFQKPNPFPKSIYENIAWGARVNGYKGDYDELVETSLRSAALWDEVKDKLKQNALRLSGGQQQRLCIARTIAVQPEVILMDEPASALDPIATSRIEELILELKMDYTIVIVTHNMGQASRVSDYTAFFMVDENRTGYLQEYEKTEQLFLNPVHKKTEEYISGKFG
ncbi:MAG: phosphate ABC transporter ATP-binding protein PstB [Sphaerochaeta sp.]|jgi:phosphate transport system ATP-binding protein|uniref:phosphate ABC transporter ATP-binding protein PstB n=1 Tax=unclassified Sphaerochaeta TaxID=2637943 RepID=UPI000EBED26F|nr:MULTISPECIES: phosphate ABC transporter ATP-binding protein PstB [unclassified Sphaerochaeta]MCK9601187.1 phosphate ABC transporter ATP-binding protein PstB [Sphaerochaeta sp.]MDX9823379.1 phosphate ABC transporter ATP-binding protein PstB [Sphaerochaeta sp.]HAP56594.1 phosphate ABC transporter ATP-binding protein [Sphaerochaeta sp.]HPE92983.1 phosphate ABC transporter ATP-binding protein PstB [Sphaerochaeta sp.]